MFVSQVITFLDTLGKTLTKTPITKFENLCEARINEILSRLSGVKGNM